MATTTRKQIWYEDDVVAVYNEKGVQVYFGLEDYEPNKRDDWRWDEERGLYTLGTGDRVWTKVFVREATPEDYDD